MRNNLRKLSFYTKKTILTFKDPCSCLVRVSPDIPSVLWKVIRAKQAWGHRTKYKATVFFITYFFFLTNTFKLNSMCTRINHHGYFRRGCLEIRAEGKPSWICRLWTMSAILFEVSFCSSQASLPLEDTAFKHMKSILMGVLVLNRAVPFMEAGEIKQ